MRQRLQIELVLAACAACFIAAAWTAASLTTGGRWAVTGVVIAFWAFVRAVIMAGVA